MTEWLRLRPEPGYGIDPAIATPTDGGDGAVTRILESVEGALGQVPALVWIGLLLISGAATVITLPVARRHARLAGARAAGHTDTEPGDRALFFAAMIPAALFLGAVLAGSFRGLAAFGRDELRWTDGWEYLVPGTLDGVALSFGFLAFRAVRKQQSPDRANRLVWSAALASAVINFAHEARLPYGSWLGGLYLALMSVFGMLIFHEFLAQFEEGAEAVHRKNPKFGLRWITWPSNTACAWIAWHNYPPAEGTQATVAASVAHLEQVRAQKRARLAATDHPAPWWTPILPWLRVRQLEAIGEAERAAGDKQRADMASQIEALASSTAQEAERTHSAMTAQLAAATADRAQERARHATEVEARQVEITSLRRDLEDLHRALSDATEKAATDLSLTLAETATRHAEEIARIRAEASTVDLSRYRDDHPRRNGRKSPKASSRRVVLTDEEVVEKCVAAHPEQDFVWSQAEVVRVGGVGFARAPSILPLIADYHGREATKRAGNDRSETSLTDDQEDSRGALATVSA